ncbi:MAG: hypothetical protein ACOCZ3_02245 [Bacillota bacterium]
MRQVDAQQLSYRELNRQLKQLIEQGESEILLKNVNGQRYLGDGLNDRACLIIEGTPGNDLAAFANGIELIVRGNGQDGVGNTMNQGRVIIHGQAGDILGYSMRGGLIYVRGNVGYRVGIHMKGYRDHQPTIIVGGSTGDFLGEYMAGGRLIVLGLDRKPGAAITGNHLAAGMHGGVIYIRDKIEEYKLGVEARALELNEDDYCLLKELLADYCREFDLDLEEIMRGTFTKLLPVSSRPYGNMYAY